MKRILCGLIMLAGCLWPQVGHAQSLSSPLSHPAMHVPRSPVARTLTSPSTPALPIQPAVARIFVAEKGSQSIGSGTLVDVRDQFGLVVTNWHVIRDATGEISVVFPDGFRSAARVIQHDQDWDLAALSIWRPNVSPVRISSEPPKAGEPLTIVGYGSDGTYRAVTGPCTQYLAPSENHPHEIVELAVKARQGDSGGPILNSRGELAGVLFGSDRTTTSGAYGGRVLAFLQPVLSGAAAVEPPLAAGPAAPSPPPATAEVVNKVPLQALEKAAETPVRAVAPLEPVPLEEAQAADDELRIVHTPFESVRPDMSSAGSSNSSGGFTSQDFVGRTPIEQVKAALSVVGLIALAALALRINRGEAKSEDG